MTLIQADIHETPVGLSHKISWIETEEIRWFPHHRIYVVSLME